MDASGSPAGIKGIGGIARPILAAFIVYGLAYCAISAMNFSLNSDYVMPGLASMEIARHGNYLLSGYYLYSDDPFLFTDILMLNLVPQALSGYAPVVLKAMSLLNFLLAILAFAYIIYKISGSTTKAMVFSALALNLGPYALKFYLAPVAHTTALTCAGLLLALFYYAGHKSRPALLASIILANLAVFSDTIIAFWFIIPFVVWYLWYLWRYRPKDRSNDVWVGVLAFTTFLTWAYKTLAIDYYLKVLTGINDLNEILTQNLPSYIAQLFSLLSPGMASLAGNYPRAGIADYLVGLAFLALLAMAIKRAYDGRKSKGSGQLTFLYFILIASGLIILFLYLATTMGNTGPARYLIFTALGALMLISLSFSTEGRLYPLLLFLALAACVGYGILGADQWTHAPNAREYGLAGYLDENNLTYGYSDYWTANLVTYLSGERVTLRPVSLNGSGITPYKTETAVRWYDYHPQRYALVVDERGEQASAASDFIKERPPEEKLYLDGYAIYVYDDSSIYGGWQFEKVNGYQQLREFVDTRVLSRLGLGAQ